MREKSAENMMVWKPCQVTVGCLDDTKNEAYELGTVKLWSVFILGFPEAIELRCTGSDLLRIQAHNSKHSVHVIGDVIGFCGISDTGTSFFSNIANAAN